MSWEDVRPIKSKLLMEVVQLDNEEMQAGVTIRSVAEFQRQMGRGALRRKHRIKVSLLGTRGAVLHHSAETGLCFRIHVFVLFPCFLLKVNGSG